VLLQAALVSICVELEMMYCTLYVTFYMVLLDINIAKPFLS